MPSLPSNPEFFNNSGFSPSTFLPNPRSPETQSNGPRGSLRSCITCRRRKVRCNKETPCSNCSRNGVACIFPPPGRARPTPRGQRSRTGRSGASGPTDSGGPLNIGDFSFPRQGAQYLPQVLSSQDDKPETLGEQTSSNNQVSGTRTSDTSIAIHHQFGSSNESILGREQWIERCLYFGEGPPRSLCQVEGLSAPSSTDHGDHIYASSLKRLTELLVEPQGSILVESVDEEMESASDNNSTNLVDCPLRATTANPDHYAFIIGYNLPDMDTRSLHPSPSQIPFYWQTFVENVEPLIKIFHIPSMNKLIREMQRSIRFLSPSKEAFMFAMYYAAVTSMTPNEVQELLDQDKETLAAQYRLATQKALAKAEFMSSSDLMTLQAFVLFLFCLREREQSRFTWTMTALAVRIAQGIGIHRVRRDTKLPPYDTEISLRLWLSIWLLDLRTALDQGTDWLIPDDVSDVALPLNINDPDLDPASVEYPSSRTGMTDMAPTLVKYEIGSLLKKLPRFERESEGIRPSSELDWDDMERIASTYKKNVEEKYLHNSVDDEYFQWLTALNTRLFFAKVPLLFYHPVLSSDARSTLSPAVRDRLWTASIETLECSYAVVTTSTSLRWSRLFHTHIHWHAISIILEELCLRSNKTEIAQRAWKAIELALGCWGSYPTSQQADELWKPLIRLMRTAKKRREADQSLYAPERNETEPSPNDSSMTEIWALANSETQLSWPTDYSAGYLYEDLDEVLIDDTGAGPSEVID